MIRANQGASFSQATASTTISLHLVDGGMGDDDLQANGEITDAGGAATGTAAPQSGGGGGGCFIFRIR